MKVFSVSDEVLARRAAAGHRDSLEELLARHRERVYRHCRHWAGNPEDSEDWAQECFVRVYRQLGHYDPAFPFAPWLMRVVSNTCVNLARRRACQLRHVQLGLTEAPCSAAPDPLATTLSHEEAGATREAVRSLSPPLRQALKMRVLEERSFREIAEILGVPLQTAATRVRRALSQVRKRLTSRSQRD